jgi:epoxide hydrolase-like predicted phosphatase
VSGPPIEAIVSDFGGVLTTPLFDAFLHFQESHGVPLETLGVVMQRIADRDGENPLYGLERGEMTQDQFNSLLADGLRAELGREVDMGGFVETWFGGLETNHVFVDWLRDARERRGLRLALLTNNVREWEARWRAMLPVDELFETVVDSAFVGMRKPDPAIYELTLDRLGLPAAACAFVDDFEHNCAAAAKLGMHAVVFRDAEQAISELEALLDG